MSYRRCALLLIPPATASLIAIAFLFPRHASVTSDDVEIVGENKFSVLVRYNGHTGNLYKSFDDDFSEPSFRKWFGEGRWTTIDTLSPASPSLQAYVDLRRSIFAGQSDFLDNRIEAVDGHAKFIAVAPSKDMVTSKSLLEHNQLWFVKGDDLWYRGRYCFNEGVPFTIADFQERGRHNSPGPRITLWEQEYLGYELKSGWKPKLRQRKMKVPRERWFTLTVHLILDDVEGNVRIWQDDQLVLDESVATLPASNSILNALEVGITATDTACEVLVDDVAISHSPLAELSMETSQP
ncbi:membrane or secreted protein [Roseiconus lacunae]|uniref:membrane or secreted protein n=1 Tax=Roseiconus lacunae TaxID=2605694 RepID=UPI003090A18E|nr:membrane or secreted protein [Stieleria sp. HD01]